MFTETLTSLSKWQLQAVLIELYKNEVLTKFDDSEDLPPSHLPKLHHNCSSETSSTSSSGSKSIFDAVVNIHTGNKNSMLDWNKGYQNAIISGNWALIAEITKEFTHLAVQYSRILVEELGLPLSQRTITPIQAGGVAGGEKYLLHGLLFKFAIDPTCRIYADADLARASAGHELKGLDAVMEASGAFDPQRYYSRVGAAAAEPIFFPLQCLVDYRGYRLIASSLLPIQNKKSLVYGCSDVASQNFSVFNGINCGDISAAISMAQISANGLDAVMEASGAFDPQRYYSRVGAAAAEPIFFPLQCLVDYRGYRLIASSLLPIQNKKSLVYGCSDVASQNFSVFNGINCGDISAAISMAQISANMNLKPHRVGDNSVNILHAVDLEVHRSTTDSRLYALDFARTLPPECSDSTRAARTCLRGTHLTHLLRPEYLKRYLTASLSPDTLSNFTKNKQDRIIFFNDNRNASNTLLNDLIPDFSSTWSPPTPTPHLPKISTPTSNLEDLTDLREKMHRNGINMRFLGRIFAHHTNHHNRALLLAEMIARIAKADLHALWRSTTSSNILPGTVKFERAAISYLNVLLSPSSSTSSSSSFWGGTLLHRLRVKYGQFLSDPQGQTIREDYLPPSMISTIYLRSEASEASQPLTHLQTTKTKTKTNPTPPHPTPPHPPFVPFQRVKWSGST